MQETVKQKTTHIYLEIITEGKIISEGKLKLPISVGRHSSNTICFSNSLAVSRHHLVIDAGYDHSVYVQNKSKNGYLLNNKKFYNTQSIKENDVISFSDFQKSIHIKTIYDQTDYANKSASKPSLFIQNSQSKIIQIGQILQQRMRSQLRTLHTLYLSGILLLIIIAIFTGYYFIKNYKVNLYNSPTPQIIIIKDENQKELSRLSDSEQTFLANDRIHRDKDLEIPFTTLPTVQEINKNFKKIIGEIILKYGDNKIAQNGFYHNGYYYSPFTKEYPVKQLRSAAVYLADYKEPIPLTLSILEAPFFRFQASTDHFIPLEKPVETDLSFLQPQDIILLLEYRRKESRLLLTVYHASILEAGSDKIICRSKEANIRLGCLAISAEQRILGMVTDIDTNHTYLIETMEAINKKLSPVKTD